MEHYLNTLAYSIHSKPLAELAMGYLIDRFCMERHRRTVSFRGK